MSVITAIGKGSVRVDFSFKTVLIVWSGPPSIDATTAHPK